MVLSFHPSTRLKGDRAFLISDNYLVTAEGAVRLSPKEWTYKKIEL
jgi:Xaa-Pro aminopeptidase